MNTLRKIQAIAICLVLIISEVMFIAAFNFSWFAIGIVTIVNLIVVVFILEQILNRSNEE